uniref:Chromo domain-containing protein n=1 Tax=Caenorhabditis tropicalis TaxID=1561998 RepID=A0A1I7TN94_9PELO
MEKTFILSANQKIEADEEYDVEKIHQSRNNGEEYQEEANRKRAAERKRKADSSCEHSTLQEEETAENDEQLEWEVERITAWTINEENLFVKWKGYGMAHCSWIKKSDLPYPKKLNELRKQEVERNRISGNGPVGGVVREVPATRALAPQTGQNWFELLFSEEINKNNLKSVLDAVSDGHSQTNIYYKVEATDGTKGLKTSAWMKEHAPMLLVEYFDRVGREFFEKIGHNDLEIELF